MKLLLVMAKRFCIGQGPMSLEKLRAFLEKVKGDTSLQENLKQPNYVVKLIILPKIMAVSSQLINFTSFVSMKKKAYLDERVVQMFPAARAVVQLLLRANDYSLVEARKVGTFCSSCSWIPSHRASDSEV